MEKDRLLPNPDFKGSTTYFRAFSKTTKTVEEEVTENQVEVLHLVANKQEKKGIWTKIVNAIKCIRVIISLQPKKDES